MAQNHATNNQPPQRSQPALSSPVGPRVPLSDDSSQSSTEAGSSAEHRCSANHSAGPTYAVPFHPPPAPPRPVNPGPAVHHLPGVQLGYPMQPLRRHQLLGGVALWVWRGGLGSGHGTPRFQLRIHLRRLETAFGIRPEGLHIFGRCSSRPQRGTRGQETLGGLCPAPGVLW